MGWFDALKQKLRPVKTVKYADMMSGYAPIFSQFGTDIYASDVVQQCINCIVQEVKKLRIEHIRVKGNDIIPIDDDLQTVFDNPNPLMTTSDFLEKITWLLFLNYNVFIVPVYHEWTDANGTVKRKYEALYPIQPMDVSFIEDASGELFVKFKFANGEEFNPIRYRDIIHIRHHYSVNSYMGGNLDGQPDNDSLLKTLEINHELLQGIAAAMKASYAVNAVVKYNTMMDDGATEAALKELEAKLKNSASGFLPLDLKSEFIPIKKDTKLVDAETLKFIDEKILRHFGVSLPVLKGEATPQELAAFYQKTIESIVISYAQAFTKGLITKHAQGHGNRVKLYPKELIFQSVEQTLQMVTLLSNTGAMFENEKRAAFGLRPLAELEGKRYMSLNWIDANNASQYQTGKPDGGVEDAQE